MSDEVDVRAGSDDLDAPGVPPSRAVIVVVAAVIERDAAVLITRRLAHTHLGGLWEFPGGKVDPGESHEAALARELDEELGVTAIVGDEILVTEHAYPERIVRLHFRWCTIEGTPQARLNQEMRWMPRASLNPDEFPAADAALIGCLKDWR